MTTLFCTPYQGHKLSELISDLSYKYVWVVYRPHSGWEDYPLPLKGLSSMYQNTVGAPALTLQELRDVAQREFAGQIVADPVFANAFETWVYTSNAPDLADWVIARLEESK
jgi:hypothetical protein